MTATTYRLVPTNEDAYLVQGLYGNRWITQFTAIDEADARNKIANGTREVILINIEV